MSKSRRREAHKATLGLPNSEQKYNSSEGAPCITKQSNQHLGKSQGGEETGKCASLLISCPTNIFSSFATLDLAASNVPIVSEKTSEGVQFSLRGRLVVERLVVPGHDGGNH